jgi:hypothetical protein
MSAAWTAVLVVGVATIALKAGGRSWPVAGSCPWGAPGW